MTSVQTTVSAAELQRATELLAGVHEIFKQRLVGQDRLRVALISTMLAKGHILLESVPGLAKTTAAQTLAESVSGSFHRIQCTPDLMPNDIVGTQIYNQATGAFSTQLGPVHANFVLMDEINRSSAKTQSAMLEAMQEGQTSIGGVEYPLPRPFMVLATQNPIEEEGTYVLPEAQMDRFLIKEVLTYPGAEDEVEILNRIDSGRQTAPITGTKISLADLEELQSFTARIYVDEAIKRYIVAIINATRGTNPNIRVGSSPRGGIALMRIAQALALQANRSYVIPEDIKALRHSVLRHRIIRTFDAIANQVSTDGLIDSIFQAVPTP